MIGRETQGRHGTCVSTGVLFELRTVPVYIERTEAPYFKVFNDRIVKLK